MEIRKQDTSSLEMTNQLLLNSIKLCDKYYNQIEKKLKAMTECRNDHSLNQAENTSVELKDLENEFWTELKTLKETNEPIVIQYIVGVYIKLQQIALFYLNSNKRNDIYFINGIEFKSNEIEFLYNIYIHMGDLNRYQKLGKLAKQYYLKARVLSPYNGQSYNQLALIYSQDPIKSIYFYVRAYLAVEPSKIALNNLKLSIKHFLNTCPIIKLLFDDSSVKLEKIKVDNWLYLIVIAIFADNISAISQYLFDDVNYWFKFKSISIKSSIYEQKDNETDFKCTFASFDLFLDYCTINQNSDTNSSSSSNATSFFSTKFNLTDYEKRLRDFKQLFNEYTTKLSLECVDDPIALRHDFMLQGLSLLQKQHSKLIFSDKDSKYATNLNRLICRINLKLNQLVAIIDKKHKLAKQSQKKIRNVALQSILSGSNNV